MANRCKNTTNLEVHHIDRGAGNSLINSQVLCHDCHVNTRTYGQPGFTPPDFESLTKDMAKRRAGFQCQCRRDSCH